MKKETEKISFERRGQYLWHFENFPEVNGSYHHSYVHFINSSLKVMENNSVRFLKHEALLLAWHLLPWISPSIMFCNNWYFGSLIRFAKYSVSTTKFPTCGNSTIFQKLPVCPFQVSSAPYNSWKYIASQDSWSQL